MYVLYDKTTPEQRRESLICAFREIFKEDRYNKEEIAFANKVLKKRKVNKKVS